MIKEKLENTFKDSTKRAAIVLLLFFVSLTIVPTEKTSASQIDTIQQKIDATRKKLNAKQGESKTLSSQVAIFDDQIHQLQLQIEKTQQEMDQVNQEIADTNQKIKDTEMDLKAQKATLFEYLRVIYEEGNTSTLELIVVSNNFSDFVDKAEYLQVMQMKVNDTVEKIKTLKLDLDKKKSDLVTKRVKIEGLKKEQLIQRQDVDNQRYAKARLLQTTQGQEGLYKKQLSALYAQRAAAAIAGGQIFGGGGNGGYAPPDLWGFVPYQCTSFAAWKWNVVYKKPWRNTRAPFGHAYNWPNMAGDQGYSVSSTPSIGDIAVWPMHSLDSVTYFDIYGHVAIVTGTSGSTISVEEYNFINPEAYGTRSNVPIAWRNTYNGHFYSLSFIH